MIRKKPLHDRMGNSVVGKLLPRHFTTKVKTARKKATALGSGEAPKDCAKLVARNVAFEATGKNCIKIGLPGKLILSKKKSLREALFS